MCKITQSSKPIPTDSHPSRSESSILFSLLWSLLLLLIPMRVALGLKISEFKVMRVRNNMEVVGYKL